MSNKESLEELIKSAIEMKEGNKDFALLELFPCDELIALTVFDSKYKEIEEYQKERLKLSVPIREKLKPFVLDEKE